VIKTIHLGYEVGSGKPVEIPLRHLAITGQTQDSGKTTTLEALIVRSQLKAIAFVTKRGERSFAPILTPVARFLDPYFRERADWQFVSSILEATLHERVKFQRSWIMKVCRGASTLAEVHRNIQKSMKTAKGLNESVYTELDEYFKIVMPELARLPLTPLFLASGLNVMNLSGYSPQFQQLVIASTLEHIYQKESGVITVIPEAWEFIPQQRNSPVKLACETLIRKGATLGNYIWLDSQDLAAVDKNVLRSIIVWIMGVQREANEVERTLKHIPFGDPLPKAKDIMALERGQFFVSYGRGMSKVYVQPAWLPEQDAINVATGKVKLQNALPPIEYITEDDEQDGDLMYKEKYESAERQISHLKKCLQMMEDRVRELMAQSPAVSQSLGTTNGSAPDASLSLQPAGLTGTFEQLYSFIVDRLQSEAPALIKLATIKPEIAVSVKRETIQLDTSTLKGRIALLLADGFFNERRGNKETCTELAQRGWPTAPPNVSTAFSELVQMGFLRKQADRYYRAVDGMQAYIVDQSNPESMRA